MLKCHIVADETKACDRGLKISDLDLLPIHLNRVIV